MTRSLHIIGSKASGGAERFYLRLLDALATAGEEVHALHPPDSAVDRALPASIPRTPVAMRGIWDLYSSWRIRNIARSWDADIVQTYMGRATRLAHFSPKRRPVHVARLGGYYDLKGYRHAHAWVGNTRGICDYLIGSGLPAQRVFHIGNFVTPAEPAAPETLAALRHEYAIPADALLILAVGRLHPVKGMEDLLMAFARLPDSLGGRPLFLSIVGDGPSRSALHAEAARLHIGARVVWAGWQDDPAPWYELADLFVCPSRHEPLGNVILEAWAHRRAIVATATLGALELIEDGSNGLLVPVSDPERLATAIGQLLNDSAACRQLAAGGTAALNARFSESAVVGAYREMYHTLLTALGG